ncbi:hypothetical protein GOV04_04510 [Candidatus Woesearchaeota archaeon]|nr:hypothetical protein [Candidatus Woesearchaeota archaeon]
MKKTILLILITVLLVSSISAKKIVEAEDNNIKISSWEYASCQGILCSYEFTIENLDSSNRQVNISNIFENTVEVVSFERWQENTKAVEQNNAYVCNTTTLENGTTISSYCDNMTIEELTVYEWTTIPVHKYSQNFKTSAAQTILLHKNQENTFRVKVRQPLGRKTKFDIITENWDGTETKLDPWIDTSHYSIDLSEHKILVFEDNFDDNDISDWTTGDAGMAVSSGYVYCNEASGRCDIYKSNLSVGEHWLIETRVKINHLVSAGLGEQVGTGDTYFKAGSGYYDYLSFNNDPDKYNVIETDSDGGEGNMVIVNISENGYENTWFNSTLKRVGSELTMYRDGIFVLAVNDSTNTGPYTVLDFYFFNNNGNYMDWINVYNITLDQTIIVTSSELNENLTINTSAYHSLLLEYDETIVLELNDTALGNNLQNGHCYGIIDGQTALNWTLKAYLNSSKDLSRVVNYSFTNCESVDEATGRSLIIEGVEASTIGSSYTAYTDKTVYIRLANGNQYTGVFDKFIVSGNKRWAFNYDENSTAGFPTMYNITPVFYVWQTANKSTTALKNGVKNLIDITN